MLRKNLRHAISTKMAWIAIPVLFLFCLSGSSARAGDFESFFLAGNKAYELKDYRAALHAYDSAFSTGNESGALYFNRGNTHFKLGDIARAILDYLRAERLIPHDPDLKANLELARGMTRVQLTGDSLTTFDHTLESTIGQLPLQLYVWITTAAFLVLIMVLIARIGLQLEFPALRPLTTVALTLFLIFVTATSARQYLDYGRHRGVVIEEGSVLTGPTANADVELSASPGLVVRVLDHSGDYVQVRFDNLRQGWIEKRLVEML